MDFCLYIYLFYNRTMNILDTNVKQVIENSELVTIATIGEDGPHLVATWGAFVKSLDINDGKTILIPAGGYIQTEKNLEVNDRVELMVGTKQVQGKNGMGTGYRLSGRGKIVTEGDFMNLTKSKYPWARAAFVITVETAQQLM